MGHLPLKFLLTGRGNERYIVSSERMFGLSALVFLSSLTPHVSVGT